MPAREVSSIDVEELIAGQREITERAWLRGRRCGGEKKILNGECWVLNCKFVLHLYPYYERGVAGTATGGMEG